MNGMHACKVVSDEMTYLVAGIGMHALPYAAALIQICCTAVQLENVQ